MKTVLILALSLVLMAIFQFFDKELGNLRILMASAIITAGFLDFMDWKQDQEYMEMIQGGD